MQNITNCHSFRKLFLNFSIILALGNVSQAYAEKLTYTGVASCASSNCHGNATPRNSSNVLQNEYVTWQTHDLHSKAYTNLISADGKKIAEHLGIAKAEEDKLCLDCHATNVNPELRGPKFRIDDGIGCESCHGPSSKYLESHAMPGAKHPDNVKAGLIDLSAADKKASIFVSSHLGNEEKAVTHKLIGAGHPRLAFEADTFSLIGPKHWVVDADYIERKGDYQSAQTWLVGQITNAETYLTLLSSPTRSKDGIFPELTLQNCFSCHHSLVEEQWKKRSYNGAPGEQRLNTASLLLSGVALSAINKRGGAQISQLAQEITQEYIHGKGPELAGKILPELASLKAEIAKQPLKESELKFIFIELVKFGSNYKYPQYELAEQIAMGIQSVATTIKKDGTYKQKEIERLYTTLKNPKAFDPAPFTAACAKLLS